MNKIMENNETQDVQPEGNEQETTPESETQGSEEDTSTDYKAMAAKYKAMYERNAKKLQDTPKTLKTNENLGLFRDEAILIAQGMKQEELDYLNKVKGNQSYLEAKESDDFKNWVAGRTANQAKEASQLDASGKAPIGSPPREKSVSELSDDEFKANYGNIVDKALNG